jgi:hypothetical protein
MKALPLALAAVLVLAGAAQAGSQQRLLEGTAVAVALGGEGTQLQGPLGVVHVLGAASGSVAFRIEGDVRAEVDYEDAEGYGYYYQPTGSGTEPSGDAYTAVEGVAGRGERELVVFAIPGRDATVVSGPAAIAVATPSSLNVHYIEAAQRQPDSVLAEGLRVSGSGLQVRGSFVVALWEWDVDAIRADGSAVPYWTGYREQAVQPMPDGTELVARTTREQQAFLVVSDGVLTLPAEGQAVAYLPLATGDVHGELTLQGVRADMAGASVPQQVSAERFSIHGDLRVDLGAPANGRVPFQATGQGSPVIEVDGATLQWAGGSGGWPPWATWAGAAALALLAPPAALGARRGLFTWEARRLARGETLLEMEAYDDARRAVRPLLRSSRMRSEAVVIHVESLLAEGRAVDALPVLGQDRYWTLAPALRDYLVARAQAVLGNLGEARDALARALRAAPDLAAQARAEPALHPLIQDTPEGYT